MQKVIYPLAEPVKSDDEKFYEREVVAVLGKVSDLCQARGMSFVAVTEYETNKSGVIGWLQPNPSATMAMLTHCVQAGDDLDTFCTGFLKWLDDNGVDSSASRCVQALRQITNN